MTGAHSILAPSGAEQWVNCAAAPRMQLPYANDPPTPESAEGDAAHWLACFIATNGPRTPVYEGSGNEQHVVGYFPTVGDKAPNGVTIDQDMIDGAELFAEVCGPGCTHEQSVRIAGIHPHCFGTPDARQILPRKLRIIDYKYGHRFVEVYRLWQLVAYALGVIETELQGIRPDEIEFVVVQPRSYSPEGPVRTWTYTPAEFNSLVSVMYKAAHAAVSMSGVPHPNAPATTGQHCGDCKARHECTAFQNVAARIVDAEAVRTERYNLPPPQLGAELAYLDEALERLEARRDGLRVQAETHLREGRAVQGYEMGEGRAVETWRDDVTVEEVTGLAATLDPALVLRKPLELLTPTQARAALKRRALPVELLDGYSFRPRGAMKLRRSSTIRARKAFGVVRK